MIFLPHFKAQLPSSFRLRPFDSIYNPRHPHKMSSTVGSLIYEFYDTPSLISNPRPSVSRKAWADAYHTLYPRHITFRDGTMGSIDNFLGPGLSYGNNHD